MPIKDKLKKPKPSLSERDLDKVCVVETENTKQNGRVPIVLRLAPEVFSSLNSMCRKTGLTRTALIVNILLEYLKKNEAD